MSTAATRIIVALDGGVVTSVSTDDPALVGATYITIDYNVEGIDEDELIKIDQGDGDTADAYVRYHEVELCVVKPAGGWR